MESKASIVYKVTKKGKSLFVKDGSKYCLKYRKGRITHAPKGTLGIFCFKTLQDAIDCAKSILDTNGIKIKKVIPIGVGSVPKEIAPLQLIGSFYDNAFCMKMIKTSFIPSGTICYPSVKVIETVDYNDNI